MKQFDIVVTNPMWNQDNFDTKTYENDSYERFETRGGYAPASSADWAWLQHVLASLSEKGRAAVVIDTGAASRGSSSQSEDKEKAIRRWFVEQDLVDAVIQLPPNLFYNTPASGIIFLLSRTKPPQRQKTVLFINASAEFAKGKPKNELTADGISRILEAYRAYEDRPELSKSVPIERVAELDFNLSPARYVVMRSKRSYRDIETILSDIQAVDAIADPLYRQLMASFFEFVHPQEVAK